MAGALEGSCPAATAPANAPIKEVLSTICRRDDCSANPGGGECIDCSIVPSLLEIMIAEEAEDSVDWTELSSAQETLTFLCDPCVAPIFQPIISMDEPNASPFPEDATFNSACSSTQCLNRYLALARTHDKGSRGRTTKIFAELRATCSARHAEPALATSQVYQLMRAIDGGGLARAIGRLRADASVRAATIRPIAGGTPLAKSADGGSATQWLAMALIFSIAAVAVVGIAAMRRAKRVLRNTSTEPQLL
ncbi:hypothetical protein T492DRAFT_933513 [Pavlovales sp. CCMP2436]|nr:hypothetical protein T492DRAFT_933513 [Pavlovales sp. CCMP2436]|eukprot:CAMPEP_0179875450 /NCGR_PEP_ID=MMETSP0982-20121206/23550_1 /TAXON_ID=483367 /ORGANISM="non described non described, Strain CCMP 2436" /LENGTH=249 /DNA_ID=CAMNT_0021767557 /DNA_START=19 /DNA_END=768 /DNA_ORIENTATION=+